MMFLHGNCFVRAVWKWNGRCLLRLPNAYFVLPLWNGRGMAVCMWQRNGPSTTKQGLILYVTCKNSPSRVSPLHRAIIYLITNWRPWGHGWKGRSSKPEETALLSLNHFMGSAEIVSQFLMTPLTTDYIARGNRVVPVMRTTTAPEFFYPGAGRGGEKGWFARGRPVWFG